MLENVTGLAFLRHGVHFIICCFTVVIQQHESNEYLPKCLALHVLFTCKMYVIFENYRGY